jgi:hypothetical protein
MTAGYFEKVFADMLNRQIRRDEISPALREISEFLKDWKCTSEIVKWSGVTRTAVLKRYMRLVQSGFLETRLGKRSGIHGRYLVRMWRVK